MNTDRLMWANHDLMLAKTKLALGLCYQAHVDECLEAVARERRELDRIRAEELEVLSRACSPAPPQTVPIRYLEPMGMDEYIQGDEIVDAETGQRRAR